MADEKLSALLQTRFPNLDLPKFSELVSCRRMNSFPFTLAHTALEGSPNHTEHLICTGDCPGHIAYLTESLRSPSGGYYNARLTHRERRPGETEARRHQSLHVNPGPPVLSIPSGYTVLCTMS